MKLLEGKTALVTGCSRGIGKAIVLKYMEEGARVYGICTKSSPTKEDTIAKAKAYGVEYTELYCNLGDSKALVECVTGALEASLGFDILVNNAGITRDTLSFRMKKEDWQSVIDINLTAAFLVTQLVSSNMLKRRGGSIINMSSIVGIHGQAGQVNYAASKGGLIAYTKSLAKEVASRGIRVNCIAPGFIATDMTGALKEDIQQAMIASIPLKRAGTPLDVANVAVFLASELSNYVTAQVIGVDGGLGA